MANAIVGSLRVLLSMDTAEFDTATKRVASAANAWSKDLNSIGKQATALGSTLTKSITLPLVGIGVAAVKVASDFESSFAGITKTVNEATDAMGNLTPIGKEIQQGMRDMAKEIPVNVNELNKIGEAAGQLGIKAENILGFTRVMADLGVATSLSSQEAAVALAQLANITQMPQDQFDRLGSTIVGLGNNFATNETKIVDFGLRIAGAGKLAGLSEHQILSIGTAMASIGVEAEAGGTAVQKVLNQITASVATGNEDLAVFAKTAGMSASQFAKAFQQDAAGAFESFVSGLGKQGNQAFGTLDKLGLGNERVIRSFLSLAGAGDLLSRTLKEGETSWNQNIALTKEAETRYKTFESQLKVLWNQVQDVAITLGTSLLPVLKDLIAVALPLVQMIGHAAEMFAALPAPIRLATVGALGLAAAIGPMIWAFGQLTSGLGTLVGAFKQKGLIMRALNADYAALGTRVVGLTATYWPLAAAIAAVWAAWKIGNTETVKNSIAEWGLASENLTARLYRTIAGIEKMTPEQARAAVAATAAAEAAQQNAAAIQDTGKAATEFVGPMEDAADATNNFTLRQQESAKATKERLRAEKEADAERMAGLKAASELESKIKTENDQFRADAIKGIEDEQKAWREYYNWLGERRMDQDAVNLVPIVSSMDVSKMMGKFRDAVKANNPFDPDKLPTNEWGGKLFDGVAQGIVNAFSGGGDALKTIGGMFGKNIMSGVVGSFSKTFADSFLGKVLSDVLPGLGTLLGPVMEKAWGGIKKIFGIGINDEVKKANLKIDEMRKLLISTHGNMETLEARANAVGLSFKEAWGHQGAGGLKAFGDLMEEFEQRWADNEEAVEAFTDKLDDANGRLDDMIGKAADLGYEFNKNGEFTGVSFDKLKAKAEEFGVSVDGLGAGFRQQGINQEAQRIIDAFTLMDKAGGDTGGILVGIKDEIGALVAKSIALGTTIPENMRPWVTELARTHQLVDENGREITDLGKLKFGEPIKTEFEKISLAITDLITEIRDLIATIAAIPTQKNLTITTTRQDGSVVGQPGEGENHTYGGGGEAPESQEGPRFALGTKGVLGNWWGKFGSGMRATLDNVEAVITPSQAVPFAMDVLSGLGGGGAQQQAAPQASKPSTVHVMLENVIQIDGIEMKRFVKGTILNALDNNEEGFASDLRDFVGAT